MTTTYYFIQQPTEQFYKEEYTVFKSLEQLHKYNNIQSGSKIFAIEINHKFQIIGEPIEITER